MNVYSELDPILGKLEDTKKKKRRKKEERRSLLSNKGYAAKLGGGAGRQVCFQG